MSTRKGTISVKTNDIFPIIKKWLYSEHDIFLRELVSNACDAITKRKTLSQLNNQNIPAGRVTVEVDSDKKTITIADNGLGMTEAEVEKYIAQLAFSGAEEFVTKIKDSHQQDLKDQIIGKFGLGFYSCFMVADKVEVESLSMTEGAKATLWSCNGDTDYTFSESKKTEIGTTIRLFINEESKEFLENYKTRSTLKQYCSFMPYPIELVDIVQRQKTLEENLKAKTQEEQKPLEVDIINSTEPLWKKDPSTIKDEDYKSFYRELFPMDQDPLFWLHLNIDHPFELKGILYFPKLNPQRPMTDKNIKLYNKQVFVSDNVKDVIPEFLSMLKGAIDSSDIPLNVSRSALQGDPNVKKISNYIIKKVAESLKKLFNSERARFEKSWEDIGLFVKYGVISDDKFDEIMREFLLFKNSNAQFITLKEYKENIPSDYKDTLKDTVLTFEKGQSDESLRQQLWNKKIDSIEIDQYIDPHLTQHIEFKKLKEEEYKFSSIDNQFENLMKSENVSADSVKLKEYFEAAIKDLEAKSKESWLKDLDVSVKAIQDSPSAAYMKIDQQMKRLSQMTRSMGGGMNELPLKKTLVVNEKHPLVQNIVKLKEKNSDKIATELLQHVTDLVQLSSEGLNNQSKDNFVKRSQQLLQDLTGLALN